MNVFVCWNNFVINSNYRNKWDGDIPPYKPIFHDGWSPGIIDFPEDDEDNLSTIANYALIRQRQRPKSFSPPADSPKGNISIGEKNRRMERQVIYLRYDNMFFRLRYLYYKVDLTKVLKRFHILLFY